jgi:hypothetical protein
MDKTECRQFFEDWLRAYADHLHLVRQGPRIDLISPDAAKPPVSATNMADTSIAKRKSTSS